MAKIYLQIDKDGVVWDAIEYGREGYTPVDVDLPLPIGCIGGWYRWDGKAFVLDQTRYDALNKVQEREALITEMRDDLKSLSADLMQGLKSGILEMPEDTRAVLEKYASEGMEVTK